MPTISQQISWRGLDFLRSPLSANALAQIMTPSKWPISVDFSSIQARFSTLFLELGMGPGSLYSEIVEQPPDPQVYPEMEWDAEVRLGEELCISERAFLRERKQKMVASFARLMGVPESEVDVRDLPIVAIAGSGGGERLLVIGIISVNVQCCAVV